MLMILQQIQDLKYKYKSRSNPVRLGLTAKKSWYDYSDSTNFIYEKVKTFCYIFIKLM